MALNLFVTALSEGEYISIDNFKSGTGEKCNCICPCCGGKVRANVTAKKSDELKINYTNHFSHIDKKSKCNGGYKETELHLFAKSLIERNNTIKVPSEKYHYPNNIIFNKVLVEPAFPFERYNQFRPDLILTTNENEKLSIEIFVTNDLSDEKRSLYNEFELKCLEIDLSKYRNSDLQLSKLEIEYAILNEHKNKTWIYPIVLNDLDNMLSPKISASPSPMNPSGCMLTLIAIILIPCLAIVLACCIHV